MIWTIPKVRSLEIREVGPIRHKKLLFKDGINAIYGQNACGKTTVVNCILACLCGKEMLGNGRARLELASKDVEVRLLKEKLSPLPEENMAWGDRHMQELEYALKRMGESQALLVDDFGARLDKGKLERAISMIKAKKVQAIIATKDKEMLKCADNVIGLESKG